MKDTDILLKANLGPNHKSSMLFSHDIVNKARGLMGFTLEEFYCADIAASLKHK